MSEEKIKTRKIPKEALSEHKGKIEQKEYIVQVGAVLGEHMKRPRTQKESSSTTTNDHTISDTTHRNDATGTQEHLQEKNTREKKERAQVKEKNQDDVRLNLEGIKRLAQRIDIETVIVIFLVLACMGLVMYIRMLPQDLVVTDDWAQNTLQQNIRAQISQQVDSEFPSLPDQNRNALIDKRVNEFVTQHQAEFDQTKAQISEQYKSYLRYTGDDGKTYTYLGDLDSYFWLRYTRNILRHGNACDYIASDGRCMDDHILAPYGGEMGFNPSLHVFAIFGLYKLIIPFHPNMPLPAVSFLVPVIIGMLGVIPAFFIGRRLAGNVGGVFTAILIGVSPLLLSRSMGSDNDVWNVIVPLFIIWMIIESLEAKTYLPRIIFAILATVFVMIQALAWDGWWFVYLIILLGLIAYVLFLIGTIVLREKHKTAWKIWKDARVLAAITILAVYYVGSYISLLLAGQADGYLKMPLLATGSSAVLDSAISNNYWPNVLTTVAELNKASLADAIGSMGGMLFFLGALIGILLLVLPRTKWNWKHYTLLGMGSLLYVYVVNQNFTKFPTMFMLALPIVLALALYLFEEEDADIAAALIILAWFMASTYATYSGVRFIELMIPAFGIGFGVLAGRIYEWTTLYLKRETNIHQYIINVAVFIVILLVLIQPVKAGYDTAKNFIPSIDDAWWNSLKKIEAESAPNAIINSWWDFGHWFKYVADRRVSADGTTQHTHVPRWLGLALVTPDEHEAMGTLRMLDCGSDVYPSPDGQYGAYGMFLNKTGNPLLAERMTREMINLDTKEKARAYLVQHGFTSQEQERILNATHCDPPEDYFITSGDMVGKAGVWAHFGLWNFSKAYIADQSKKLSREEAVADFTTRFNMSQDQAEQVYYEARGLVSQGDINAYAAPWPGYLTGWMQCSEKNGTVVCPINMQIGKQGNAITLLEKVTYIKNNERNGLGHVDVSYGLYQGNQRVGGVANGSVTLFVIAGPDKMDEIRPDVPSSSLGFVYDSVNKRLLICDPLLAKSTFTQLFYLDGRYSKHFVKFDDEMSFTGSRVIIWKVDWEGTDKKNATATTSTTTPASNASAAKYSAP